MVPLHTHTQTKPLDFYLLPDDPIQPITAFKTTNSGKNSGKNVHVRGSHPAFTGESPRYTTLLMFAKASITITIAYVWVFETI